MFDRPRAAFGVAVTQLRYYRVRTVLVVIAVALAVLSTTLLASVGVGVLETGVEKFDASGQDLWVTGGPIALAPGTVGGFENSIVNAHEVSDRIGAHEDVRVAAPIAFQTVYVGPTPGELRTVVGVGVGNVGSGTVTLQAGRTFEHGDRHYAGGNYTGPLSGEVIVGRRTAAMLDLQVGDTLYIGGTVSTARETEYTVIGIASTFSEFLGAPTVTVHLSELQELTGTTGTDPASLIAVSLEPGADPAVVERRLQAEFPAYDVRTNREQFEATLGSQALVIVSAAALVVLAVLAGIALTANALALLVFQQRRTLAALKAAGLSGGTLVGIVGSQGLVLGGLGGLLGLMATPPLAVGLNRFAETVVGFQGLVRTPVWVYPMGFAMAIGIGAIAAFVAGWRVARISPLVHLRD